MVIPVSLLLSFFVYSYKVFFVFLIKNYHWSHWFLFYSNATALSASVPDNFLSSLSVNLHTYGDSSLFILIFWYFLWNVSSQLYQKLKPNFSICDRMNSHRCFWLNFCWLTSFFMFIDFTLYWCSSCTNLLFDNIIN